MTTSLSRLYLAIFLPMLAEDLWRLDNGSCPDNRPIVFVEKQANAMRLTALSRAALRQGLIPGLTLADARARVPELVTIDRDHAGEARLLARITAGCVRYTPMVAAEPPDGVILDIAGCVAPYGSAAGLATDCARRLEQGGLTVRLACGATPEAARAHARFGEDGSDLHRLPVEALEAEAQVTIALHRAGLRTIGDLATRPRAMLAARFGDLALRLTRLLGEEDRRISPARPQAPVFALRRFAEPVGRVEDALACLEELGAQAAVTLHERHQGGRRFVARFFRSDGAVVAVEVAAGQPTRDPALLIRLFRERMDALADPIDPGFGFDLIRLDVPATEPLAAAQDDFTASAAAQEQLAELVDRLSARLGARRIHRAMPQDTHIPECASAPCPPATMAAWNAPPPGEPPLRPLHLLDPPQPIGAVLSEVPDGPPQRFTWRGQSHDVFRWEGPERIAALWWRRRDRAGRTRDYYRVEDKGGHRFWLFRHGLHERGEGAPAWYIHGLFA